MLNNEDSLILIDVSDKIQFVRAELEISLRGNQWFQNGILINRHQMFFLYVEWMKSYKLQ